ncbi:MAG: hypothetical protein Fur0028_11880 [Bacteroidales bacterium]
MIAKFYTLLSEKRWMHRLPLFVSFPRTGSEWINAVMELYFDRPRLRKLRITFIDKKRKDWMWFHDHDIEMNVEHKNVLYLFRDPVETVYSNIEYMINTKHTYIINPLYASNATEVKEKDVVILAEHYASHINKWLYGLHKAKEYISYEKFIENPHGEMEKVCRFFGSKLNSEKLTDVLAFVTKEKMVAQNEEEKNGGLNNKMLNDKYRDNRRIFKEKYANIIYDITKDVYEKR